ncbi:MAG: 30S ribosomal protein S28e [Candidatus Woesearchaeota archaeon]
MEKQDKPQEKKPDAKAADAKAQPAPEVVTKGSVTFSPAYSATVEEILEKGGMRGEVTLIRCKILEGRDQGKVIRRNVRGPIRVGDVLMLRETEFEARPLSKKGKGGGQKKKD